MFDSRLDNVAVDVKERVVVVSTTLPSNIEIPLTEIRLIVLVVLNSLQSGKRSEIADRVGDKSGD